MKRGPKPPEVVEGKCVGCELCLRVCPAFVLEMKDKKVAVVRGEWCIGCDHCGGVCPTEAIRYQGVAGEKEPRPPFSPGPNPEHLRSFFLGRRSLRVYQKEPVPESLLNQILDAGRYAPTGSNSQNVHYVVMSSADQIDQLRGMMIHFYDKIFSRIRSRVGRMVLSWVAGPKTVEYLQDSLPKYEFAYEKKKEGYDRLFYRAPVVMLTHAESWDSSSAFNCAVALYQSSLMAQSLGLGCCFNGILVNAVNHDRRLRNWLGLPAGHRCYSAMTVGYPDVGYQRSAHRDPPKVTWR